MQTIFGHQIRQARESQNLILRKAAAALDIDAGLLSKIERNERSATREQIQRFADFYHLDFDTLLIDWLSDKIVSELQGEELAEQVLRVAEKKISQ